MNTEMKSQENWMHTGCVLLTSVFFSELNTAWTLCRCDRWEHIYSPTACSCLSKVFSEWILGFFPQNNWRLLSLLLLLLLLFVLKFKTIWTAKATRLILNTNSSALAKLSASLTLLTSGKFLSWIVVCRNFFQVGLKWNSDTHP